MRTNPVRSRLESGEPVVTGWLSGDGRYLAEVASCSGYDAVTVDAQHGMFDIDTAVGLLQAVGAGPAVPLARPPHLDRPTIGKLLDAGAFGIICPTVDNAAQAEELVRACRYPPYGERSFGPARARLVAGSDYSARADELVLRIAMIESAAALEDLDAIVRTPGLDGVFVGPNDLALSLGEAPEQVPVAGPVGEAMRRIARTAVAAGRFAGVFCAGSEEARHWIEEGYRLVAVGNDATMMRETIRDRIADVRRGSAASSPAPDSEDV